MGVRAPHSPGTPHPSHGTTHHIWGPASHNTTALWEKGELRTGDGDRRLLPKSTHGHTRPLRRREHPSSQPGVPPALVFIPVILGAGVFTHLHPPCLPQPFCRETSLGIAPLQGSQTSLLAGLLPWLPQGHPPPYPSRGGEAAPRPTPDASPAPQQPWVSRELRGGGCRSPPLVLPVAPCRWAGRRRRLLGAAAGAGGGGGQPCAHAAGMTAHPITQGHLSQSCRTPTSAAACARGGYEGPRARCWVPGRRTWGCRGDAEGAGALLLLSAHPPRAVSSTTGAGERGPSLLSSPLCS